MKPILAFVSTSCWMLLGSLGNASDHADPVDPLYWQRQEGAITDLFVFPVLADQSPAFPFTRVAKLPLHDTLADIVRRPLSFEESKEIDALVFILCLRRQLTDSKTLVLNPYTYRIHIDVDSVIDFPTEADLRQDAQQLRYRDPLRHVHTDEANLGVVEAFARYGGKIQDPGGIHEDITIEFRLNDKAQLQPNSPAFQGNMTAGWETDKRIECTSGVFDDPFIFPSFYGTNVVGIALRIPIDRFSNRTKDYLIWATSHQGRKQLDHVGRSLRTQNPRFEMLNRLHPSQHERVLLDERAHPSLMRDLGLRLNLASLYALREWDFVPDVMCYSTRYPVGFPNGRLLTDDVAAILAQHGDTLLYELSYQDPLGGWPRQATNDRSVDPQTPGVFAAEFPYLLPPRPDMPQPALRRLSRASILKLLAIAVVIIAFMVFTHWSFAKFYHYRQLRQRYL